ncbi:Aminoacylase-1 [Triticum urartu]|uniref:Aminoacylase-1 n=1 Tax=Triticum urartu TaxID=4572 RepID=M7ZKZ5_TRIUA|nr:Aminoacylase-1 [Triticum urartu]
MAREINIGWLNAVWLAVQRTKGDTIAKVLESIPPNVMFIRDLIGPRLQSWNILLQQLTTVQLSQGSDVFRWNLHGNGQFSVESMYRALIQSYVLVDNSKKIWKMKISLKNKIFAWYLHRRVILTKDNLIRRNWHGSYLQMYRDASFMVLSTTSGEFRPIYGRVYTIGDHNKGYFYPTSLWLPLGKEKDNALAVATLSKIRLIHSINRYVRHYEHLQKPIKGTLTAVKDPKPIVRIATEDMKCVGMQYLEAIRRLRDAGFVPDRNIYIIFVPDEEIGGHEGVELFVASNEFKELNVGLVLDEGLASPREEYRVFYAERSPWWLTIKAKGAPGHGAKLYDGSAMENLMKSVEALRRFRTAQFDLVKSGEKAEGDVVSVNFAYLKAGTPTPTGFVMNLQPSEAEVGIDIRIPPSVHTEALEKRLAEEWAPSSRNLTFEFKQKGSVLDKLGKPAMTIADSSNPWWPVFEESVKRAGGKLGKPEIFPASTDARYFREIGIPAFGFSPMANTPVLLHDHNEFLSKDEYLKGIGIYESIIKALATHKDDGIDEESRAELSILHGWNTVRTSRVQLHGKRIGEYLSTDGHLKGIGMYNSIIKVLAKHKDDCIDEELVSRAEL